MFVCMNVYVLYGSCFMHKLVRNQPNIDAVNQAQSTNQQIQFLWRIRILISIWAWALSKTRTHIGFEP